MQQATDYDVVIAGAGMVGAGLACALAGENIRVAILEASTAAAENPPSFDDRGITLSVSSKRILAELGLWAELEDSCCPVHEIHVTDQGHFGCVRLQANEQEQEALGYIVVARELGRVLNDRLEAAGNIDILRPARVASADSQAEHVKIGYKGPGNDTAELTAGILVVADGARSRLRELLGIGIEEKDYRQTALVANVVVERPRMNTAFERFTPDGPLALLPLSQDRYVMVYTVDSGMAAVSLALDETGFLQRLQDSFGWRLGRFLRVGTRQGYPLQLIRPATQVQGRAVLLGNAAHTIHPNAAQGLNLCLRDMMELAGRLKHAVRSGGDPGSRELLEDYLHARLPDQRRVIAFSDRLAWLFYNRQPLKTVLRNIGMVMLDIHPGLKQKFITMATGLGNPLPPLMEPGSDMK